MLIFYGPFIPKPKEPEIPKAATAEGDELASEKAATKAADEARRRSRAASLARGSRAGLLTADTTGFGGQRKLLTGS